MANEVLDWLTDFITSVSKTKTDKKDFMSLVQEQLKTHNSNQKLSIPIEVVDYAFTKQNSPLLYVVSCYPLEQDKIKLLWQRAKLENDWRLLQNLIGVQNLDEQLSAEILEYCFGPKFTISKSHLVPAVFASQNKVLFSIFVDKYFRRLDENIAPWQLNIILEKLPLNSRYTLSLRNETLFITALGQSLTLSQLDRTLPLLARHPDFLRFIDLENRYGEKLDKILQALSLIRNPKATVAARFLDDLIKIPEKVTYQNLQTLLTFGRNEENETMSYIINKVIIKTLAHKVSHKEDIPTSLLDELLTALPNSKDTPAISQALGVATILVKCCPQKTFTYLVDIVLHNYDKYNKIDDTLSFAYEALNNKATILDLKRRKQLLNLCFAHPAEIMVRPGLGLVLEYSLVKTADFNFVAEKLNALPNTPDTLSTGSEFYRQKVYLKLFTECENIDVINNLKPIAKIYQSALDLKLKKILMQHLLNTPQFHSFKYLNLNSQNGDFKAMDKLIDIFLQQKTSLGIT